MIFSELKDCCQLRQSRIEYQTRPAWLGLLAKLTESKRPATTSGAMARWLPSSAACATRARMTRRRMGRGYRTPV